MPSQENDCLYIFVLLRTIVHMFQYSFFICNFSFRERKVINEQRVVDGCQKYVAKSIQILKKRSFARLFSFKMFCLKNFSDEISSSFVLLRLLFSIKSSQG